MIYFVSGRGSVLADGAENMFCENSYWIVPPHTQHTERFEGEGELLFVGFRYADAEYALECNAPREADPEMRTLLYKIFDEYRKRDREYTHAMKALFELTLISCLREKGTESGSIRNLDYMKAYIDQYHNRKIDFGELAALSGYSYDYFRRLFKEKFGISPKSYLMQVRLSRARRMLEEGGRSCTEIAYMCGFSNSAQLSTMFKERYGVPPSRIK